ncbi:PTS sugar transporter subunit IIC [Melissococcus plutonius]|uniref:Transcriptional regulator pfoR n=1 Tax=Melissococcus plutonius TaxID=33970 RepID=A0A2Z5Y4V9_9ENTE|nr:PTS sugar transporter subunit IIC [Melissococcus plutonius]BAL62928.1 regulatory protein PfoR [Melissococcus plutonius DAT561]MCV2498887.1 PTS sugar transporter subunit IIC [Melissococcus plutonius]MCV2501655.1 PTS sugar transporter subunit IIC [Melissococcus plutonius]MCV2505773.1 PTS sugar transporter subunit IIC [Melissococcus plutonius]MCV2508120.1 PTS sugar transporter subunit IIC [Melissococcus plutonius]
MKILLGVGMLLLVILVMFLFAFYAPNGRKALSALSGAACSTFLPEAFLHYAIGDVFHIQYIAKIGETMGGLGGLAAGTLVPLAFGISPVFSVIMGVSLINFKLLPAFVAAYLLSFVLKQLQKYIPEGIDLIVIILVIPLSTYFVADIIQPFVMGILQIIGNSILSAIGANPYFMGALLGVIIPIVGMTPLSSMVLTALIGLTGVPMAIGALGCFGNSILNFMLFNRLPFGDKSTALAVTIEPLTQIDIISSNPIPIFGTNAVAGAINGMIVTYFGLKVPVTGMATPWAGLLVVLGNNPINKALITVACIVICSLVIGFIGSIVFKNFKLVTVNDLRKDTQIS